MLDRLEPRPGARHRRKRVGRGPGSGLHKTSGRGVKGQGKRSAGRETPAYSDGGQMPLVRRLPKRGFRAPARETVAVVNVGALGVFGEDARVDVEILAITHCLLVTISIRSSLKNSDNRRHAP